MNGGFIVYPRSIVEHPAFRDEGEAMLFVWLMGRAAWKPTRVRYKERAVYLKRGQLALSLRDMARKLGQSVGWIQRFLNRLKIESMIDTRSDSGVLIITICNYAEYQDKPDKADSPSDSPVDSEPIHSRFTEQQREQENKDSLPAPTVASGDEKRKLIPEDWEPPPVGELSPMAQTCAKQWPPGVYAREAEGFKCYWQSERKKKTDWKKTWQVRIISMHGRVMREGPRQPGSYGQAAGEKPYYQLVREGLA